MSETLMRHTGETPVLRSCRLELAQAGCLHHNVLSAGSELKFAGQSGAEAPHSKKLLMPL